MKKQLLVVLALLTISALGVRAADAKEHYDKQCAKCHGAGGKGDTKMGQKLSIKDLTDPKRQAEMKDEEMFKAIKEGVKDGDKVRMKAGEGLNDEDIKALVAYVRKFKK